MRPKGIIVCVILFGTGYGDWAFMAFSSIEQAVADLKVGKMVIVVDDENRENEGDLVMAAQKVTPEAVNFMAKEGRGLICLSLTEEKADSLGLNPMARDNTSRHETAFTVSIDAKRNTTTGISAYDRFETILQAVDDNAQPSDFAVPGHIFPLRARRGGVLTRVGHTEASVDLCQLAGLKPAGVICEVMNEDCTMARLPQLEVFAQKHGLRIISIEALVRYRTLHEKLVTRGATAKLPTEFGDFKITLYNSTVDSKSHSLIYAGFDLPGEGSASASHHFEGPVLVRVHSECLTGDALGSLRCDCGKQLRAALERIAKHGVGALLYMRQEGRGIGLENKIRAYALQDDGLDTVEANEKLGFAPDLRDYGIGAQILHDAGLREITLLTNNPRKIVGLDAFGIAVTGREPLTTESNKHNSAYLKTKRDKMGHLLE
ncbi:3,4-dihydroxy-2-butanone 4-phosphate synthase [uncultured archaeon]|nr:3,4-dihydroxy-2-butanone 4-phosphate synthase [uncultured archaeon]